MAELTITAAASGGRAHGRVGAVRVIACDASRVEMRVPGDLGWGRAMIGLVPVAWCAAAWAICLRQGSTDQRLNGCVALTIMAVTSLALMRSSLGRTWRFDAKRRRFGRVMIGPLTRWKFARQVSALRLGTVAPSTMAEARLRLVLLDRHGRPTVELCSWSRRDVDRVQAEELAQAIRAAMGWGE
jgi:hypothetical protein